MTVTIQKEVGDRIIAPPGTKDYGAFSVWVQSQCRAEILRILPQQVFWPRPKVQSAFMQIIFDPELAPASPTARSSTSSCARCSSTAASSCVPNC